MDRQERLELAARLIDARRAANLTQEELAQEAGTSPSTVSGLESGKVGRPQFRTLHRLASVLGLEVSDLYREPATAGKADAPPELEGLERRRKSEIALATLADHTALRGEALADELAASEGGFPLADADEFLRESWALWVMHGKEPPAIQHALQVQEAMERLEAVDRRLSPLIGQWFGPERLPPEQWDTHRRFSGRQAESQRRLEADEGATEKTAESGA